MVALRLVSYLAFAAMFLAIAGALYSQYQAAQARVEFLNQARQLAELIEGMAGQDEGSTQPFRIRIPGGMKIWFEGESVIVDSNGGSENFPTQISIVGPSLPPGEYRLSITRTSEGVEVGVVS
jgi:hypothetical protein